MTPLEQRLAALAAAGQTATYGQLAKDLGLRMADLTAQLESLMEVDAATGKPFRAALLRQRLSSDHLPAPGFFLKAAALGHRTDDPTAFTKAHRDANFLSPNIPG
ncbi:MGMT family protein [Tabrizicola aquatica]|uniref:MGMT family protein n=1 Tax=Tabrizicola aquatica TaxID=909926 RepID=UPI000CD2C495|nr:MGMT family protein [Tabrizicola aquatica]